MLLFFPVLIKLLTPNTLNIVTNHLVAIFLIIALTVILALEISTYWFMQEYNGRPNQIFFQYLGHPMEIFGTVWEHFKIPLIVAVILLGIVVKTLWRYGRIFLQLEEEWSWRKRLIILPIVIFLLTLGARSGFNKAAPNISLAAYTNNYTTNQIALNSSYSLAYAVYRYYENISEVDKLYGDMRDEEVLQRIKKYNPISGKDYIEAARPTLRKQSPRHSAPRNLVIIIAESLGSDFVGRQGGIGVTPHFDELSRQGLFLNRLYATGTRTYRGFEAIVAGFPPSSHDSTASKLDLAQTNFFTIGALLKQHGYDTSFFYGGEAHFDNMASFILGNGFDTLYDHDDYPEAQFKGVWGIADEDVFAKANTVFKSQKKPFASVILTLSNHSPFDFPEGRITAHTQPVAHPHNSAKYADYALGKFFETAIKEAYFKQTVFLIVGDHPLRMKSGGLVPVSEFRVPALFLGPGVPVRIYDKLASQIDLLPTLIPFLGIDAVQPMIGNDLVSLPTKFKGRAIMNYYDNMAFIYGDKVSIYTPHNPVKQFQWDYESLREIDTDPELARDGLAHILFPGLAYREAYYAYPNPGASTGLRKVGKR